MNQQNRNVPTLLIVEPTFAITRSYLVNLVVKDVVPDIGKAFRRNPSKH